MLGNFSCFCRLLIFFKIKFFLKILARIPSAYRTVKTQIRPDILSGLIWVLTVCKDYPCISRRHWKVKGDNHWTYYNTKIHTISPLSNAHRCKAWNILRQTWWLESTLFSIQRWIHIHNKIAQLNCLEIWKPATCMRVCLFDLILYLPSTIFQFYRDRSCWVEPVLS